MNILGRPLRWVNSLHRQAVNKLGKGLRIAATDANSIVQAIEHETLPFVVGVQWHPEYLLHRREQRAIFRALVRATRQTAHNVEHRPSPPGREHRDSAHSRS